MGLRYCLLVGLRRRLITWILVVSCSVLPVRFAWSGSDRVLPVGKLPQDARLGPLKDLNGYFPFFVPASADAWKEVTVHG